MREQYANLHMALIVALPDTSQAKITVWKNIDQMGGDYGPELAIQIEHYQWCLDTHQK